MTLSSAESGEATLASRAADVLASVDREPGHLIPALQALQKELGYLPTEALAAAARHFRVAASHVYGVATFYAQFRLERQGDHRIRICWGTACHVRGSAAIMDAVHAKLGVLPGETTSDYRFTMERVACLGSCALAPVVVVDDRVYGQVTPERMAEIIDRVE